MDAYISERNDKGLFHVVPVKNSQTRYDVLYVGLDTMENVFWSWNLRVQEETWEELLTTLKYIISDPDYDEEGKSLYGYENYRDLLDELKLPEDVYAEFDKKLSQIKRK